MNGLGDEEGRGGPRQASAPSADPDGRVRWLDLPRQGAVMAAVVPLPDVIVMTCAVESPQPD